MDQLFGRKNLIQIILFEEGFLGVESFIEQAAHERVTIEPRTGS